MKIPPCHSRSAVDGESDLFICHHPQMHARDNLVSADVCKVCHFRTLPPPDMFRAASRLPRLPNYRRPQTVAVVIPCHNYAHYLGDAIESVLRQTRRASEIVVVDDASTDDTRSVTESFRRRFVGYRRVEHRHSQKARRAGYEATQSDVLCFLDADDALDQDYLEKGLACFTNARVGIVYSDVRFFGQLDGKSAYPAQCSRDDLARRNILHTGCLVLREAIDISRGFDVTTDDRVSLQDWLLWRRILADGWEAKKQTSFYGYRRHTTSMTADWEPLDSAQQHYFDRASLAAETLTLFIALSGRTALWPRLASFLERQTWPHDQIRLVLFDTSQNEEFSSKLRQWIAGCDYRDVRHIREEVGQADLADRPRVQAAREVTVAMARIYTRMARELTTDYVWILEDDILPPDDACERLLRGFDASTGSVSAAYPSRFESGFLCWRSDDTRLLRAGHGLAEVGGNGFGCVILRAECIRNAVFTATLDFPAFDYAFYYRLRDTGLKAKVDWRVVCAHGALTERLGHRS